MITFSPIKYYLSNYWHLLLFTGVCFAAIYQTQTPKHVSVKVYSENNTIATLAVSKPLYKHVNYKHLPIIEFEPPVCLKDKDQVQHNSLSLWYKIHFIRIPKNLTLDFYQYETVLAFDEKGLNIHSQIAESQNNTPQHHRHISFDISKNDMPQSFYFKVYARKLQKSDSLQIRLEDSQHFHNRINQEFIQNQHIAFWIYLVLGIGFFQLLYIGSLAWSRRKEEYVYYWLFVFVALIYMFIARRFELGVVGSWQNWTTSSVVVYLGIFNFFYCRFIRFYLDTKTSDVFLDKQYRLSERYMLIGTLVNLFIYALTLDLEYTSYFFKPFSATIILLDIYMLLLLFRLQSPLIKYLMMGAAFFVVMSFLGLLYKYLYSNGWVDKIIDFDAYGGVTGAVLDAICLNLGLNYKHRLENIAQQHVLENERNRIASEMHDDLGSGLTTIRLLSEHAQMDMQNAEKRTQIHKITKEASDLIEKMSTLIWAMNTRNDSVDNIVQYLRRYAFEYLQETHDLDMHFLLPDLPPSVSAAILTGEVRREVFLTFKEALHNIIKHAEATQAYITIQLKNNGLEINIRDNGKGFKQENTLGNGLKNMAERMTKIDGIFQILDNPNCGTQVTLTIPLTKVSAGI